MTTTEMHETISRASRGGAECDRHPNLQDLWPTAVGPNVLAWSYADEHPECHTIYTVYKAHPGGHPHLQFSFHDGTFLAVPIDLPERFGAWDTPHEFRAWVRAWHTQFTEEIRS